VIAAVCAEEHISGMQLMTVETMSSHLIDYQQVRYIRIVHNTMDIVYLLKQPDPIITLFYLYPEFGMV